MPLRSLGKGIVQTQNMIPMTLQRQLVPTSHKLEDLELLGTPWVLRVCQQDAIGKSQSNLRNHFTSHPSPMLHGSLHLLSLLSSVSATGGNSCVCKTNSNLVSSRLGNTLTSEAPSSHPQALLSETPRQVLHKDLPQIAPGRIFS